MIQRIDRNWCHRSEGMCPKCIEDGKRWPFLSVPWEGRSDIVTCWRCKRVYPRFIEVDIAPRRKKRRGGKRMRRKNHRFDA